MKTSKEKVAELHARLLYVLDNIAIDDPLLRNDKLVRRCIELSKDVHSVFAGSQADLDVAEAELCEELDKIAEEKMGKGAKEDCLVRGTEPYPSQPYPILAQDLAAALEYLGQRLGLHVYRLSIEPVQVSVLFYEYNLKEVKEEDPDFKPGGALADKREDVLLEELASHYLGDESLSRVKECSIKLKHSNDQGNDLAREISRLNSDKINLEQNSLLLSKEIDNLKADVRQLTALLNRAEEPRKELQQEIDSLERQLDGLKQQLRLANGDREIMARLEREVKEEKNTRIEAQENNATLRGKLELLDLHCRTVEEERKSLRDRLDLTIKQLAKDSQEKRALSISLGEVNEEKSKLDRLNSNLTYSLSTYVAESKNHTSDLEKAQAEINKLKDKITTLETHFSSVPKASDPK